MLELLVNGEIRFSTILKLIAQNWEFLGLMIILISSLPFILKDKFTNKK